MTKPITYVAFLRGINVGGHKPVKMDALKKSFESIGFRNVKTILASGNVLFESSKLGNALGKTIEKKLEEKCGHKISVILRTKDQIQTLMDSDPFKGIKVTPQSRLYVTFLSEKPTHTLRIPYESSEKDFKILSVSPTEVCSVLTLSPKRGTTDAMNILEKIFGRNVTTRNWNTVIKILKPL
jgi:uncharacterized protein (DUF1697 family)